MSMLINEKKFGRGQSRIEGVALWVCKVTVVCKLMLVYCNMCVSSEKPIQCTFSNCILYLQNLCTENAFSDGILTQSQGIGRGVC